MEANRGLRFPFFIGGFLSLECPLLEVALYSVLEFGTNKCIIYTYWFEWLIEAVCLVKECVASSVFCDR